MYINIIFWTIFPVSKGFHLLHDAGISYLNSFKAQKSINELHPCINEQMMRSIGDKSKKSMHSFNMWGLYLELKISVGWQLIYCFSSGDYILVCGSITDEV